MTTAAARTSIGKQVGIQPDVKSPDEYLARVPEHQAEQVRKLRNLVLTTAPDAREEIKWGMISYHQNGGLFAIAAQKHYVSFYILATGALDTHKDELVKSGLSIGKGCIRFKGTNDIPLQLLQRVVMDAVEANERSCKEQ